MKTTVNILGKVCDGKDLEIDPHKLQEGQNRDLHIQNLQQTCQNFLLTIMEGEFSRSTVSSVLISNPVLGIGTAPVAFNKISSMLQQSVRGKFDKSRRTVVGGCVHQTSSSFALVKHGSHCIRFPLVDFSSSGFYVPPSYHRKASRWFPKDPCRRGRVVTLC